MWSQQVRGQTSMKHKVTQATQVTLQCVNILILSDNGEEKYAFGIHYNTQAELPLRDRDCWV